MKKVLSILTMLSLVMASVTVQAGVHTDAHGNVGYDTLEECQAAIADGTAQFYKPHTVNTPLLRKGEKTVKQGRLGDLHESFRSGTCDVGTGRRLGRDGVSKALHGKYIPYSPDMTINAYANSNGDIVRVTMQQCDNWFSGDFPKATLLQSASTPTVPEVSAVPAEVVPTPVVSVPPVTPTVTPPVAASGAVSAAKGSTSMLVPLGVLGAIGIGTAVLMNNDSGSSTSGTSGTTGTTGGNSSGGTVR